MNDNTLNMDRKPFSNTSDPQFYYMTNGARKAYKNFVMGIASRAPLMTLSGDPGTGKTTLIQYLMAKTSPAVHWLFLSQTFDSASDFFNSVGKLLGIPASAAKHRDLVEQIRKQLIKTFDTHDASVLVIDEAQCLPNHILERIISWQNQLNARNIQLSILFSGHRAVVKRLSDNEITKGPVDQINGYRLSAMTFDECRQMVEHRIRKAGYQGPPLFKQTALKTIYKIADGNPRRIITVCDLVVFTAAAHFGRPITPQDVHDISAYISRLVPKHIEKNFIGQKKFHSHRPFQQLPATAKRWALMVRFGKRQWFSFIKTANDHRKTKLKIAQRIVSRLINNKLMKNKPIVRLPAKTRMKRYLVSKQQLFWPWGWAVCYLMIIAGLGYVWLLAPATFVTPTAAVSTIIHETTVATQLDQPVRLNEIQARLDPEKKRQVPIDINKSLDAGQGEIKAQAQSIKSAAIQPKEEIGYRINRLFAPMPSHVLASINSINAAFKYQDHLYLKTVKPPTIQIPLTNKKDPSPIALKIPEKPPALNDAPKQRIAKKKYNHDISVEDLALTVARGDAVALNAYLDKGADPNTFISKDHSLLTAAVDKGSIEMVQILVNKGAQIDLLTPSGETALMKSAWTNDVLITRWLLANGAQINLQNQEGWTPLFYAAIQGHTEVAALLLNQGAKWDLTDEFGRTPLMAASWNGHDKMVQNLLTAGANANRKDRDGWTPLMFAAFQGHTEIGEKLLFSGADLTIKNNENQTPADLADEQGHEALHAMISSYSHN